MHSYMYCRKGLAEQCVCVCVCVCVRVTDHLTVCVTSAHCVLHKHTSHIKRHTVNHSIIIDLKGPVPLYIYGY